MTQNNDNNTPTNTERDKSSMESYLGKDWERKVTPDFRKFVADLTLNNNFEDAEKHLVDFYGNNHTGRNLLKSLGVKNLPRIPAVVNPTKAGNEAERKKAFEAGVAASDAAVREATGNKSNPVTTQTPIAPNIQPEDNETPETEQEIKINESNRLYEEYQNLLKTVPNWDGKNIDAIPAETLKKIDDIFSRASAVNGTQLYFNPEDPSSKTPRAGQSVQSAEEPEPANDNNTKNFNKEYYKAQLKAGRTNPQSDAQPAEEPEPANQNGYQGGGLGQFNQGGYNNFEMGHSQGNTLSTGHNTSETNSSTSNKLNLDPQLAEQMLDFYNAFPTAASELFPLIKDDLDPEKIAEKKKGIAFRQGMHELLENMRVLSDIGTSFAGGNAYKRNAPDYRRYEAERASVDKARKDALDMIAKAKIRDNDFLRNLMATAFGKSWESNTKQNTIADKTETKQQTADNAKIAYTPPARNVTNNYNGRTPENKKYWTAVKIVDENGNATGAKKIHFNSKEDKDSYYDSLAKFVVGTDAGISENALRNGADIGANTSLKQAFEWAQRYAGKSVPDLLNNNNIPIQDRFNYLRELLQGNPVYNDNGEEICSKLTNQQRENILGSVILSEQMTRDLLDGLGIDYTLSNVDDKTSSNQGRNNSDYVRKTNNNSAPFDAFNGN